MAAVLIININVLLAIGHHYRKPETNIGIKSRGRTKKHPWTAVIQLYIYQISTKKKKSSRPPSRHTDHSKTFLLPLCHFYKPPKSHLPNPILNHSPCFPWPSTLSVSEQSQSVLISVECILYHKAALNVCLNF